MLSHVMIIKTSLLIILFISKHVIVIMYTDIIQRIFILYFHSHFQLLFSVDC